MSKDWRTVFASVNPRSSFIYIHDYLNNFGEIADHSVCFHVNYLTAVSKALSSLQEYSPSFNDCQGKPFSFVNLKEARLELLQSYDWSLSLDGNPLYTCSGVYLPLHNGAGEVIPGIKYHKDSDLIYLDGLRLFKKVKIKGNPYHRKMEAKTLAKLFLRELTPLHKWGQYSLGQGRFSKITIEKRDLSHTINI